MKKSMLFLIGLIICSGMVAQVPQEISYQAVVRNSVGALLGNQDVGVRVSILQGSIDGTEVYREIFNPNPQTNVNGLVAFVVGSGIVMSGAFANIDWENGPFFIKTEIDPTGGTNYSIIGTTQLLSVPYALLAKRAENENDPVFLASPASAVTGTNITNWNTAFSWGDHAGMYRPISWVPLWTDVTEKPSVFPPSAHLHGNITNDGKIGSAANRVVVTGTGGSLTTLNAGTTNQYLRGDGEWETPLPDGIATGEMLYWSGSAWINVAAGNTGEVLTFINGVPKWGPQLGMNDVQNPSTGKIWMDRNLGAIQVATSSTDANAYGHLYQWGRGADGHQIRTSGITTILSSSDTPGHGNFIVVLNYADDWRSPQNDNLWQGVNGVNNPCPTGYRLPTEAELNAEHLSWTSDNSAGAFASPLKLTVAGYRIIGDGSLGEVGSRGLYWSSTVNGSYSRCLDFASSYDSMSFNVRGYGFSVRCLKD